MFITGVSFSSELILVVFSILLWVKNSPIKRANRLLGLAFSLLAVLNLLMLFLYTVHSQKMYSLLTWYFPFDQILIMFIGPAIYFYVLLLFNHSQSVTPRQILIHALPALPALVYVVYFITLPLPVRVRMLMDDSDTKRWMDDVLDNLFYIQSMAYLLICFLKVNKQRKSNYLLRTNGYESNIRWLHQFIGLALVGLLIQMPVCIVQNFNEIEMLLGIAIIALLGISVFIQSVYMTGLSMQHPVEIPRETEHGLKLEEKQVHDYLKILHEVLDTNQLYLQHNCTLETVSIQTNIPEHHISCVLNSHSDKNFSEFINEHRCKYASVLLENKDYQNLTLEAIGKMSGFGTRANFHNAFKKMYGKTPSKYQADLNRNGESDVYSQTNPSKRKKVTLQRK